MGIKKLKFKNIYYIALLVCLSFAAKKADNNGVGYEFSAGSNGLFRIGDYDYPSNPMNDRAKGYSIQGKVKNGLLNFGAYIDWDYNPSGGWGQYAYLPSVAFMAGVPGYISLSEFTWEEVDIDGVNVWESSDAYDAWAENTDNLGRPNRFSGIAYNIADDRGELALQRVAVNNLGSTRYECIGALGNTQFDCEDNGGEWTYNDDLAEYAEDAVFEWVIDTEDEIIYLHMLDQEVIPNNVNCMAGLVFPWAFRPKLETRFDEYDKYDYGPNGEEWDDDDYYDFYGATTSESWFSRWNPKTNTDWHAATKSSINTHNLQYTSGDVFGNTIFTGSDDTYPLLAHSNYPTTWPIRLNSETLEDEPVWPGWYADEYYGDDPDLWLDAGIDAALCGTNPSRTNPDCWKELPVAGQIRMGRDFARKRRRNCCHQLRR